MNTALKSIYIVLVTSGKHDSVDFVKVCLFKTLTEANEFCQTTNTGPTKYWKKALIIRDGKECELASPE